MIRQLLFLLLIVPIVFSIEDDEFLDIPPVIIEHSFNDNVDFSKKGSILFRPVSGSYFLLSDEKPLSTDDLKMLHTLADINGLYFIRIRVSDGDKSKFISSSVPACSILASNMHLTISLAVDSVGQGLSTHIVTPKTDCNVKAVEAAKLSKINRFTTTIHLSQPSNGPVPETVEYLRRIERQREEKARAEQTDNRSFLSKYWMYIVIVLGFLFFSSNAQEPEAEGG